MTKWRFETNPNEPTREAVRDLVRILEEQGLSVSEELGRDGSSTLFINAHEPVPEQIIAALGALGEHPNVYIQPDGQNNKITIRLKK